MPSAFDDAWQDGGVLDDHFGEEFTIQPRTAPMRSGVRPDVNARPTADVFAGPPVAFVGLYQSEAAIRLPASRGHSSSDAQAVNGAIVHVEYAAAAIPFEPKLNDLIIRLATGTVYAVAGPGEPVNGRRRLRLTSRS